MKKNGDSIVATRSVSEDIPLVIVKRQTHVRILCRSLATVRYHGKLLPSLDVHAVSTIPARGAPLTSIWA